MINVSFAYFDRRLPETLWADYLRRLPQEIQNKTERYVRWEDRQRGLLGKLLLLDGLVKRGYAADCLERLSTDKFGRPFLEGGIDFNISHSGGYAVCAITREERVGIDVEAVRDIKLSDFRRYMNVEEWRKISASSEPYEEFHKYWTKKESIMKADGRGFSIPLEDIRLGEGSAVLYDTRWFLKEISVRPGYRCHIASDSEHPEIRITETDFF